MDELPFISILPMYFLFMMSARANWCPFPLICFNIFHKIHDLYSIYELLFTVDRKLLYLSKTDAFAYIGMLNQLLCYTFACLN